VASTPSGIAVGAWEEDIRYDEIAIGWNEIFDPDVPSSAGWGAAATPAAGSRQASRKSTVRPRPPTEAVAALFASEVLTSKKPPEYLRIGGGKRSQIEKGMKEVLMNFPMSQPRKPAEVMESQLDQLRAIVASETQQKRREARQHRRLQRRCRVRNSEDLEVLEAKYLDGRPRVPLMQDPAERTVPLSARGPSARAAATKDFFVGLGRRQLTPSASLAAPASPAAAAPSAAAVPAAAAAAADPGAVTAPSVLRRASMAGAAAEELRIPAAPATARG